MQDGSASNFQNGYSQDYHVIAKIAMWRTAYVHKTSLQDDNKTITVYA